MVFRNLSLFVIMNGGDGGSDRPQGFARRTASSAPRTVAFGPQPVRRFTGPAHLRLCPHWLRLPPTAPTVATKKQAQGLFLYVYGGDGGSRTHVRKHFRRNFSERS